MESDVQGPVDGCSTDQLIAARIAVVIPAYRVRAHLIDVVRSVPYFVWRIYVVDDACPESSGKLLEEAITDSRVTVLYQPHNTGVGAATMRGYCAAIEDGAKVLVKIDGDGQMDPTMIPKFVVPILWGDADYTKGNRFFDLDELAQMPSVRLFGNAALSFLAKLSTGYWDLFDPTNGYTAIHAEVARHLPFDKISSRYFFETDMLFRLNTIRAVAIDVPMSARYGDEVSNLRISQVLGEFLFKHAKNFAKRIFYNYYLRDMSLASIELPAGLLLMMFGTIFGAYHWYQSSQLGVETPAGTVMLAALPLLTGIQLILAFLGYDISAVPRRVRHKIPSPEEFGKNSVP